MIAIRKVSPAMYCLAGIAFLLPWLNISCGGQRVASFTGIQLVTGTTIETHDLISGSPTPKRFESQPWAVIAFLLTLAGLLAGLAPSRVRTVAAVSMAIGGLGAVSLLLLKCIIDHELLEEAHGAVVAEWAMGFWAAAIFLVGAVGWNAWILTQAAPSGRATMLLDGGAVGLTDQGHIRQVSTVIPGGEPLVQRGAPHFLATERPDIAAKQSRFG